MFVGDERLRLVMRETILRHRTMQAHKLREENTYGFAKACNMLRSERKAPCAFQDLLISRVVIDCVAGSAFESASRSLPFLPRSSSVNQIKSLSDVVSVPHD